MKARAEEAPDPAVETNALYETAITVVIGELERRFQIGLGAELPRFEFDPILRERWMLRLDGRFESARNLIALHRMYMACDPSPIINRGVFYDNNLAQHSGRCHPHEVRSLLAHELGHFYIEYMMRKTAEESWMVPLRQRSLNTLDYFGLLLVSEGVGEYFECTLGGGCLTEVKDEWFTDTYTEETFLSTARVIMYEGGYALMKPLLDRGVEEGVRYILDNPLVIPVAFDIPDLRQALRYREKALRELETTRTSTSSR